MKQRVISGIIMLLICFPIVLIGGYAYIFAIALLSMFAYKEVIEIKSIKNSVPLFVKILGVFGLLTVILSNYFYNEYIYASLIVPVIFMLLPMVFSNSKEYNISSAFQLLGMIIFLGLAFSGLLFARDNIYMFLYLISITVFSDIFAYVTGLLIGKHKLCPAVSPKKTIEGSVGGLIVGMSIPIIIYVNLIGEFNFTLVVMTFVLAVFSQLGDLVFSKIKRDNNVKDFSNLIPGHGGILDRIDSLLIVSLVYLMILQFI